IEEQVDLGEEALKLELHKSCFGSKLLVRYSIMAVRPRPIFRDQDPSSVCSKSLLEGSSKQPKPAVVQRWSSDSSRHGGPVGVADM
ncbi:hypothetical protein E4U14_000404, partial [Claviceps sp. LM454 group G7]